MGEDVMLREIYDKSRGVLLEHVSFSLEVMRLDMRETALTPIRVGGSQQRGVLIRLIRVLASDPELFLDGPPRDYTSRDCPGFDGILYLQRHPLKLISSFIKYQ